MENIYEIARYFLSKNPFLTVKQVQKLVYYAYSWYIVNNNTDRNSIINRLCAEHPEAWVHGPVFYDLYEEMTYRRQYFEQDRKIDLNINTKSFLDIIYNVYGKYTGNQLEDMTHNEAPWIIARSGLAPNERSRRQLDDAQIYEYFAN